MRRAGLLVLALLVLPATLRAQEDAAPAVVTWDHTLRPDPEAGLVRVEVRLGGMEGVVTRLTFLTSDRRDPVTDVAAGPATDLRHLPDARGFEVTVDGPESFSYAVDVRRDAPRGGERLAHVGPDFALFKAEAVALAYTYQYYEGRPFVNRSTVRLDAPAGWDAAGPWAQREDGAYLLPDDQVLPRGFVAFGDFRADETRTVAGVEARFVRLGAPAVFEPDLFAYLERATPYYRAVYGPGPGPRLLVVTAGDPMLRGGLGASDSLYVHEAADLRTVAHEYAHVHQLFGPDERAGTSSVWLTEGDADWHGALSLHAAGLWSASQVNEFLDEAERARHEPALRDARLPDATYGATLDGRSLERFAYHKGSVVLRALDAHMRDATDGAAGVPDLLRRLNARHADRTQDDLVVGNSEAALEAARIAGEDVTAFFALHVLGNGWPDAPDFEPAGELGVHALRLEPPRVPTGGTATAVLDVANRGTRPLSRELVLTVDDATLASLPLTLAVGEARTLRVDVPAGAPGEHEVRVLHERATLRTLTPPSLRIGNVSVVPTTPRAGHPFQLLVFIDNAGETQGAADVRAGNATANVDVPPLGTAVATLTLQYDTPGNHTLDLRMADQRLDLVLRVLPPETRETPAHSAFFALAASAALATLLRRTISRP